MRNQIPKEYVDFDLYCNLVPNQDEHCPTYQQVPRTGAFEVSYKGFLIFSKIQNGYWPNTELVSNKCCTLIEEHLKGRDVSEYLAGLSPIKGGGSMPSQRKGQRGTGASPKRSTNGNTETPSKYMIAQQDTEQPQPLPFH